MAYNGYLVKIGTYTVPFDYIKYETYQAVYSVNDLDSYRDANGELHRTALKRRTIKVEWETPDMSNSEFETLMGNIRSQYLSAYPYQKAVSLTAYVPEINSYVTEVCYLTSDVNFSIRAADSNGLRYSPVRLAFIGYTTSATAVNS